MTQKEKKTKTKKTKNKSLKIYNNTFIFCHIQG